MNGSVEEVADSIDRLCRALYGRAATAPDYRDDAWPRILRDAATALELRQQVNRPALVRLLSNWYESWNDGHGIDGDVLDDTVQVLDGDYDKSRDALAADFYRAVAGPIGELRAEIDGMPYGLSGLKDVLDARLQSVEESIVARLRPLALRAHDAAAGEVDAVAQEPEPVAPTCYACAYSYMEPDSPFLVCGHPDAGTMGEFVKREPLGHCPDFCKFKQHSGRRPDGSLRTDEVGRG